MPNYEENQEVPLIYIRHFREYGIRVLDGGDSFIRIAYCPWCGCKLAESLREAWFSRLEELGLESGDPDIPKEMESDAWWK